jgi:hypothetical protein
MAIDPLLGPKLKVKRANAHIQEIKARYGDFLALEPYRTFEEVDPKTGDQLIKVEATKQPPADIAIIAGEVLYLLRSALDHLITAVATKKGVTNRYALAPAERKPCHIVHVSPRS